MAKTTQSAKPNGDEIINEIDRLAKRYEELFSREDDIKALQGIERCLEMKIKYLASVERVNQSDDVVTEPQISLSELPTELLLEIFNAINSKKMKQQL